MGLQEILDDGWVFKYEHGFIEASHPQGGKYSVCELCHGYRQQALGSVIADLLNQGGYDAGIEAAAAYVDKSRQRPTAFNELYAQMAYAIRSLRKSPRSPRL